MRLLYSSDSSHVRWLAKIRAAHCHKYMAVHSVPASEGSPILAKAHAALQPAATSSKSYMLPDCAPTRAGQALCSSDLCLKCSNAYKFHNLDCQGVVQDCANGWHRLK